MLLTILWPLKGNVSKWAGFMRSHMSCGTGLSGMIVLYKQKKGCKNEDTMFRWYCSMIERVVCLFVCLFGGSYKNQRDRVEREVGGGSGWGIHVTPWLIHVNVWQNPLQYCKVISLQLIKINEKKVFGIWYNFDEISSLSHSIVFLYFIALITEEGFLISPCSSLELYIQMGISFLFFFAFSFFSFLSSL